MFKIGAVREAVAGGRWVAGLGGVGRRGGGGCKCVCVRAGPGGAKGDLTKMLGPRIDGGASKGQLGQ